MAQLNVLNVIVDFGFMNSLSIPVKYLEETIRPVKADFPLTYKTCWSNHEHIENDVVIDSTTGEIICIILWENINNGINNFVQLHTIEVNKRWRNGGLGSVILQDFMSDKEKIYARVYKRAKNFYIKNGFKMIEDLPNYACYIKEK